MNTQYIQLLQIIENFASEHKEVRRFKSDFLEQLQNFSTTGDSFPILYVVPNSSAFNISIYNETNLFTVNIYALDLINEDRTNVNTILNTTNLILNDLHLFFKDAEIMGIDLISVSNVTPVNNYLMDVATGWYMTMTFEVDSHSVCEIPFNDSPIIPTGECDIIYSRWATQEQLLDLQTNLQIEITNVENTLQGEIEDLQEQINNIETFDCSDLNSCPIIINLETKEIWTIELIDALTVDFYAPYNMTINTITNLIGTPIIDIKVDDISYTINNLINAGSKITVTSDIATVINLNTTK